MKKKLKYIWYHFARAYIAIGLFLYFKRIKVYGRENIPKKGAILFVCNHPNALLDPLLIKTSIPKDLYVLTRAGVFVNSFLIKLFESVKMIPIYRKRDGWNNISKNDAVFDKCHAILNEQKCILIFPEGSHSLLRKVRPLTKGFGRIIFGTLEKHPNLEIQVVPIGLNYDAPTNYPSSVSIYYGKPIFANQYFNNKNVLDSIINLKEDVQVQMSKLTTQIDGDKTVYLKTLNALDSLKVDYLNPTETNKIIKNIDDSVVTDEKTSTKKRKNPLYYLVVLNSFIPWVIWQNVQPKIKDIAFKSTFRFALGITLFPIFYILQSFILSFIFNGKVALIYFTLSLLCGILLSKTSSLKI